MKAICKTKPEPGLWLEEVPLPTIKSNEVLIKIKKTSICGTDVHIDLWDNWAQKNVPTPLIVGHEFMGIIEEVGSQVTHLKPGMRVSGEGHLTCGSCISCMKEKKHLCKNTRGVGYHVTGCFAEYFALPAENVFVLPDGISDDIASIFDPYGNAVHTALSFNLTAEDVLITGAGPIGIMAAGIAKKAGARNVVITDYNPFRLDLAQKMGATKTVNLAEETLSDAMRAINMRDGFTVGLEMSGNGKALNSMLETAENGAKIALLGILPPNTSIDWDLVIFKMLEIKGIYGREIFNTWTQMTALIESGLDLSPVITHRLPFEEFQKGLDAMKSGQSGKVILDWK